MTKDEVLSQSKQPTSYKTEQYNTGASRQCRLCNKQTYIHIHCILYNQLPATCISTIKDTCMGSEGVQVNIIIIMICHSWNG